MTVQDLINTLNELPDKSLEVFSYFRDTHLLIPFDISDS